MSPPADDCVRILPSEADDEHLARLAGADQAAAFEQLVLRWQDRLYRFLLGRLGNTADAQDALQEAFVNAWRYRASYRQTWRYSTWLYRIALREAGRIAQRRSRREPALPEPEQQVADAARDPTPWVVARKHLSQEAFSVVWLHYHEDWNVTEIARCVQRPKAWVRLSLHRSRRRLAKVLPSQDS